MPGLARYQQVGNNMRFLAVLTATEIVTVVVMVLFVCWETNLIGQDNLGRGFLAGGSFLLAVSAEGVIAALGHPLPGRGPTNRLLTAATGSAALPLIGVGIVACFA